MKKLRQWQKTAGALAMFGLAVLLMPYWHTATAAGGHILEGGDWGVVRSPKGEPLEGIGVQLISPKTAIRTTVYSDEEGRYEFPKLETGGCTLRVTRPLEYRPFQREL